MTQPVTHDPTEAAWFGLDSGQSQRSLAAGSLQLRTVRQRGLHPAVTVAVRLMELVRDPEFSVVEVGRLIESDPGLTARVIGIANSPMFPTTVPCRDVTHAVTLVGARTLGDIAAGAAVASLYGRRGLEGRLRAHAVSTAAIARELALQLRLPTQDLFVAGLLHDVGKLILLQARTPEDFGIGSTSYAELIERGGAIPGGVHWQEREALGFDHAAIGSVALDEWGIPQPIPRVVGLHHSIEVAIQRGGRTAELVCLLQVADALAHAFQSPALVEDAVEATRAEQAALAWLGVDEDRLRDLMTELHYAQFTAGDLLA